jgi:hypothetical protein
MLRPGATAAFAPPQKHSMQITPKLPATRSMLLSRSADSLILQSRLKLPTAIATTRRCPTVPTLRKSSRPGLLITQESSSSPSAQQSSSSKTAPSSSYAATSATTSSTGASVASSHTSARSTATRRLRRSSCSVALIAWCLRRKSNRSRAATARSTSSGVTRRSTWEAA